jgi:hypothetical protein
MLCIQLNIAHSYCQIIVVSYLKLVANYMNSVDDMESTIISDLLDDITKIKRISFQQTTLGR